MKLVDISGVTKRYSNHLALNNVSFSIEQGNIFGLLGPNGAGKTTLIRILNQITAPDSGTVFFNGRSIQRSDIEKIGYLPEERGLYKKMKVGEQALYLAQLKDVPKDEALKRLRYWFAKFEIESWWNRRVEELSKGMQQKVQFITTIIHEPDFLIFDEPFSGFDPINATILKNEILDLKKKGKTIILSSHNMASVEEICDEIVLLNNSNIILEGKLIDVKRQFRENHFEIEINEKQETLFTSWPSEFEILSEKTKEDITTYTIHIKEKGSSKELLQYFLLHANVLSFREILPSMNDIFITQVNRYNAAQK